MNISQTDSLSQNNPPQEFFKGLRREVFSYLKDNKLDPIDQGGLLFKAIIVYLGWAASYLTTLWVGATYGWAALYMIAPSAFFLLCIVLSVMHDGSHGSFARSKWLNKLAAYSLGFAGASSMIWYRLHVRAHHDNTNVMDCDQDFESGGLLRLHPEQERKASMRNQQVYAWFLYLGFALRWVLFDDIHDWVVNRCQFDKKNQRKLLLELLVVKSWHAVCFFILPAIVMGWQIALVFYLIHWMALSIILILIFATAHLSHVQDFPAVKGTHPDWALHQLATTTDYSPNNKFLSWVVGGLNFQVVHHIFPKISHTRYPAIQKVIKAYCKKHNVTYHEFPTIGAVIHAHFVHLKTLGAPETLDKTVKPVMTKPVSSAH